MAATTLFDGPIPGQSLTDEPKNAPWENPPMYADPMDALEHYLKKLGDVDAQGEVLTMLDLGIPVSVVVDSMLSSGIMDGIHSVDVKLLLKPLMIINLTAIADAAGLDYKNTMDDYRDKDAEAKKQRMEILAAKLQAKLAQGKKATPNDPGVEIQEDVVEELTADDMDTEETMTEEAPAPTGLMAKEV
jgi:hypothetical protein